MIQTIVPLYDGNIGNLNDRLRSVEPTQLGKVLQMSAGACYDVGGFLLSDLKIKPRQHHYEGIIVFQVWEERMRSTKRLVASITVDTATNDYAVKMEAPLKYPRINATFQMGDNVGRPYHSVVYRNTGHHGDWVFDVTL
jgi:hypothetical protein